MSLLFSKTHEWVQFLDDTTALVGISDYAQSELGGLVFVNLPAVGDAVVCHNTFGDVESVKAVSDIYSPVTGTIAEINEELMDAPERINEAPYEAWMIKVENITDKVELLSEDEYREYVSTL